MRGKNYLYHYFPAMAVKMENNGDGGEEGVNDEQQGDDEVGGDEEDGGEGQESPLPLSDGGGG